MKINERRPELVVKTKSSSFGFSYPKRRVLNLKAKIASLPMVEPKPFVMKVDMSEKRAED